MVKFKIGDIAMSNQHLTFTDGTEHLCGQIVNVDYTNVDYFNMYPERYTRMKKVPWLDNYGKFRLSSMPIAEKYLQHRTGKKFSVAKSGNNLVLNTVVNGELYTVKIYVPYLYTAKETHFDKLVEDIKNESKTTI